MYNNYIKDKYALVDLARFGTKARKHIHPDVLIGAHCIPALFKEGDLLDANATLNLIQTAYDQDKIYKILSSRIAEFEEDVQDINQDLQNTKSKHDNDMQELYEYVNNNRTMVVYDGLEENLLVYNVKHG